MRTPKYLLAPFLFFISITAFSQRLEVGGGLGAHFYKGDLNPNFNPLLARPAANAMVRYNFSRAFSLKAMGSYGFLEGNDNLSQNQLNKSRGYKFTSQLTHWEGELEFNFLNFRSYGTIVKSSWTPTLTLGLGQFGLSGREFFANGVQIVTTLQRIKFGDLGITYGFGFKKQISDYWNLSGSFKTIFPGLRREDQRSNLDNYDGIGFDPNGLPINNFRLTSTPSIFLSPNTHQRDILYHTSITLSYVFKTVKCPNPKK